jgi:hypothetical protein
VGLAVYPQIVAEQRLAKHVRPAKEELLEGSFSMRSVSCQGKVGD